MECRSAAMKMHKVRIIEWVITKVNARNSDFAKAMALRPFQFCFIFADIDLTSRNMHSVVRWFKTIEKFKWGNIVKVLTR